MLVRFNINSKMLFTTFAGPGKMLCLLRNLVTSGPDWCHVVVLHEQLKTLGVKI